MLKCGTEMFPCRHFLQGNRKTWVFSKTIPRHIYCLSVALPRLLCRKFRSEVVQVEQTVSGSVPLAVTSMSQVETCISDLLVNEEQNEGMHYIECSFSVLNLLLAVFQPSKRGTHTQSVCGRE